MNMRELKISEKQFDAAPQAMSFQGVAVAVAWDRIKSQLDKAQTRQESDDDQDFAPRAYQPSCAPRPYRRATYPRLTTAANTKGTSLYELLETHSCGQANSAQISDCARDFLDQTFPLAGASHRDAATYLIYYQHLLVILENGESCGLENPAQFIGCNGSKYEPESIRLRNGELQIELMLCNYGPRGTNDPAGVEDIFIEAALNAVLDCMQPRRQTTVAITPITTPTRPAERRDGRQHSYPKGA